MCGYDNTYALFGCMCIHFNPHVLEWIGMELSLILFQSISTHVDWDQYMRIQTRPYCSYIYSLHCLFHTYSGLLLPQVPPWSLPIMSIPSCTLALQKAVCSTFTMLPDLERCLLFPARCMIWCLSRQTSICCHAGPQSGTVGRKKGEERNGRVGHSEREKR